MKRILLTAGTSVILIAFAGILYLMNTEAVLQWVINRAVRSVPGLTIGSAKGRISGPVEIKGITYESDGLLIGADEILLDWRPSALMLREARLSVLKARGVRIVTTAGDAETAPSDLPDITLPLKIILEEAVIKNISITEAGEQEPVLIHEVSLKGQAGPEDIRVSQLDLDMRGLTLKAEGRISPGGDYPARIALSWRLRIPGYEEISGKGSIAGSLKQMKIKQETTAPFRCGLDMDVHDVTENPLWEGDLAVREFNAVKLNRSWPVLALSGTVSARGTETGADILSLDVRLRDGSVKGSGFVNWQPDLSWSFSLDAEEMDPGMQWPDWPGSLDVTARSSGQYAKETLTINPSEVRVSGILREKNLSARALFSIKDAQLDLSGLEIRSGKSHISASGKAADELSLKWRALIADAGDLFPGIKGVIEGSGSLTGSRSYPVIKGSVKGGSVSYDDYAAGSISAVADIDTKEEGELLLKIAAVNVTAGGQDFRTVSVQGSGRVSSHAVSMDAVTDGMGMSLTVTGGYADNLWNGRLESALLDAGALGRWSLRDRSSLYVSADRAGSGPLCMDSSVTEICLEASWDREKGSGGMFSLKGLPLSHVTALLDAPVTTDGDISGGGEISYSAEGVMSGHVSLVVPSGNVRYQLDDGPVDFSIDQSRADIVLDERALDADAEITVSDRGHIKGGVSLPGFKPGISEASRQRITGGIEAEIGDLDLIPLFVPSAHNTSGSASVKVGINGTLAESALTGEVILKNGEAEIPDLGLKLKDINVTIKGDEDGEYTVTGRLMSGSGHVSVDGTVGLHKDRAPTADLRVRGENFEAVRTPGAWMEASPDIALRIEERKIDFEGSLKVPQAAVEPPDISAAVLPSKDVIVADMPPDEKEEEWSVTGGLRLELGDYVRFKGYGLTCRVTGMVDLTERPGKVTQGRGEFRIMEGRYKAYGQDLTIEKGRLIFVGPVDDPGLDIKAFRKVRDVTAGVNVRGTLKAPEFQVYSEPAMDESDALSYLLFGRPMRQLSGSEGSSLYGAALSAGLSAGGFVAKKIGAAFGIEDVEIEKGDKPEQATLFVGKYLSPRLYLSYGIGLFEPVSTIRLRYDLTRKLQIQTEYGLESGGDVLYTIEH